MAKLNDKKKGTGFEATSKLPDLPGKGKSWFFGIGINAYQEFPGLHNAVKDVQEIYNLLVEKYDIQTECALLLTDSEATRENIIDQLDWLVKNVGQHDKLIICYSGHGHLDKNTDRGYWIPHDAKKGRTAHYIRNSTIRDYIKDIHSLHTLLLSDSCFSGTLFFRGAQRSASAWDELETIPSRWAICSGRHNEQVYDGEPGKNSPFAESIMDVLGRNHKRALNIAKVADSVVEQTRANYTQLPEGNPLYGVGHKGGQYVFRLKADERDDWAAAKAAHTITGYRLFLKNYPDGQFSAEARENAAFLEEEEAWKNAREEHTIVSYYQYDTAYPNGRYTHQALEAIRELEEEKSWQNCLKANLISACQEYIIFYPDGKYAEQAQQQIAGLLAAEQAQGQKRAWQKATQADTLEAYTPLNEKAEKAAWEKARGKNLIREYQAFQKTYPDSKYSEEAEKQIKTIRGKGKKTKKRSAQEPNSSKAELPGTSELNQGFTKSAKAKAAREGKEPIAEKEKYQIAKGLFRVTGSISLLGMLLLAVLSPLFDPGEGVFKILIFMLLISIMALGVLEALSGD